MVPDLMGEYGPKIVVAVVGVGLALLCLVGILWIVRGRGGPSPFVRGGRNRNPRLQVLDAAAVDTRRRLVLVRRDDVEHLLMIGGPTDIVVESRILTNERSDDASASERGPVAMPAAVVSPASGATETLSAPKPVTPTAASSRREPSPVSTPVASALPQAPTTAPEPEREMPLRELRPPAATPIPASIVRPSQPAAAAVPVGNVVSARLDPPVAATAAPAARRPELNDAAVLLDSARDQVFADHGPAVSKPPVMTQPSAMTPPVVERPQPSAPLIDKPTALGSEFERILEEEMATNMAAREAAIPARNGATVAPSSPVSASAIALGPAVPVRGGVSKEDPALQNEVARIFGEMSASRDK